MGLQRKRKNLLQVEAPVMLGIVSVVVQELWPRAGYREPSGRLSRRNPVAVKKACANTTSELLETGWGDTEFFRINFDGEHLNAAQILPVAPLPVSGPGPRHDFPTHHL